MQRTYLSREMTRALALDHPIGDPFGGAAYGEKNGPAIAIAMAVISIEVGVTIGVTTLVGGLMVAGGVLSIAGTLTGNKTLSMIGSVMGMAAGVAGMTGFGMPDGMAFGDAMSSAFTDDKGISGMLGMGEQAPAAMNGVGAAGEVAEAPSAVSEGASTFGGGATMDAQGAANALKSSESSLGGTNIFGSKSGSGSLVESGTSTFGREFNTGALKTEGGTNWMTDFWGGLDSTGKSTLAQAGLKTVSGFMDGILTGPIKQEELDLAKQKLANDTTMTAAQKAYYDQKIKESEATLAEQQRKITNVNSGRNQVAMIPTLNPNAALDVQRNGLLNYNTGVA